MARKIQVEFDGHVPQNRDQLRSLPGVGEYIANMVLILSYHGSRIAIDSNVIRLATRFFGIEHNSEIRRNKKFIEFCQDLTIGLSSSEMRTLNLVLIDFPALICRTKPLCNMCPLATHCNYFEKEFNR
jgi:A/G-specific adenine glycosylase